MQKSDRITIFLSAGELFWITSYLGLRRLPLIGGHYRGRPLEEVRSEILQGYETLENRDLIRKTGARSFDVDPTLLALVNMISAPEYTLLISSTIKNGQGQRIFVYFKENESLSVVYHNRFFNLTLFVNKASLVNSLTGWMQVNMQTSEKTTSIELPQIEIRDLLLKVWEKPEGSVDLLKEIGCGQPQAEKLAETLGSLAWASTLTRVAWKTDQVVKEGQLLFLGNSGNLWINEHLNGADETGNLVLSPTKAQDAQTVIRRYLQENISPSAPEEDNEVI